jgi:hypothetical protein
MSDTAHEAWALVAIFALMVALVIGCTVVVAYFTGTAYGLWSLLIPLFTNVRTGQSDECGHDEDEPATENS